MSFDLSAFAAPLSHAQAVKTGLMIDCSDSASWAGINLPTFLSQEVVIECVGRSRDAGDRMRTLLDSARQVLSTVRPGKGSAPARLRFRVMCVPLLLTARFIDGRPVIYINLEG